MITGYGENDKLYLMELLNQQLQAKEISNDPPYYGISNDGRVHGIL